MYRLSGITDRPAVAAGLCLLLGFVGSVVGIVYEWPYIVDRVWFFGWLVASVYFAGRGVRRWWQAKLGATEPQAVVMPKLPQSRRLREAQTSGTGLRETGDTRRAEQGHPDVTI
jgi:hypothetical protein